MAFVPGRDDAHEVVVALALWGVIVAVSALGGALADPLWVRLVFLSFGAVMTVVIARNIHHHQQERGKGDPDG